MQLTNDQNLPYPNIMQFHKGLNNLQLHASTDTHHRDTDAHYCTHSTWLPYYSHINYT